MNSSHALRHKGVVAGGEGTRTRGSHLRRRDIPHWTDRRTTRRTRLTISRLDILDPQVLTIA